MNKGLLLSLVFIFFASSLLTIVWSVKAVENSWWSKSPMPAGGAVYGAAAVNGKIYAFGAYNYNGTTYYTGGKYDPATDTWSTIAPMTTSRIEFATAVHENKIYVIGGKRSQGDASLNNVEVYDPETNSWTSRTSMPTARDSMQANVVNGKIYVISGEVSVVEAHPGAVFSDATEVYDPETDTWTSATPIPNHVAGYASAVLDNRIYIIGGATEEPPVGWHAVNTTQIYNPATDNWTVGAAIPKPVESALGCATNGSMAPKRIYVFAGFDEIGHRDLNQVYDPILDEWAVGAKQSFYGYGEIAATVMDDLIYAIGGSYSELISPNPWGYTVDSEPVYNPPPPFPAINYRYTPIGYGASELTAPKIAVLSPTNRTYSSGNISLNFIIDEPTSWMGYRLDGQQVVAITGNTTLNGLVRGLHKITLYAKDSSENSGASETINFTIAEGPASFPTTLGVAVSVAAVIVGAGLLVYSKKRKRDADHQRFRKD
jgi:N-acetylneuraminic acid mutarotase